jgi:hypothetical protein
MLQRELEHGLLWTLEHYIGLADALLAETPEALCQCGLTAQDLRIWLMEKRDELSLADVARNEYPLYWQPGGRKHNQPVLSAVRRARDRVERFFNRGGDEFRYPKRRKGKLEMPVFFSSYEWAILTTSENKAPVGCHTGKRPARNSGKVARVQGKGVARNKRDDRRPSD